ncbi:uncharacterized protein K02A2.6-like [Pectinophora gossypiella]|uniref:uncharacterized protein K02A2.6-like n=1 Tax=Pectinophora gossypiella TaxID=13191 RepID=UPI00214DFB45|nr:uncharacterized protein K02A2.6-like [Pectinophora gossypiella]XP_049886538.1 uncharacterized protein K02A2.6-like [Pectinophora gossypiella]XP_049886571.1 uncharacterized protein K02A2.6-like [Pectinophora gossypiella]
MGIVKTKALARSYVWWPGVDEALEAACRACAVCASVATAPPAHAPCPWPWPDRPWSRLHVDFLGPISGMTYLIVVDACSKWIEAIQMKGTTAGAVTAELRKMWARFGLPKQIVSDNGPPFASTEFETFLKKNGVDHIFSAPYHPASNGAAENAVKICKRTIKKALKQKLYVETALSRFLIAYRNTEHYTTGDSPARILLGRSLRMRLDKLKPDRSSRAREIQRRRSEADAGDDSRRHRQLAAGESVWCRDYRSADKWLSGKVIDKLGNTDYSVKCDNGLEVHRHIGQLRRRVSDVTLDIRTPQIPTVRRSSSLIIPVEEKDEPEEGLEELAELTTPVSPAATQAASATTLSSQTPPSVSENRTCVSRPRRVVRPPVRYGFDDYA